MRKIYLIATIVAIIAGFATYFFATEIKENSSIKDVEKTSVVIAMKDIPVDTVLTADMLMVVQLPVTTVTGGTAMSINDIVGYTTIQPIIAGEQLIVSKLALVGTESKDSIKRLSYQLKKGYYAYAMNVDALQTIAGFMREGDYFDIYQISTENGNTTQLFMENIRLLKLGDYATNIAIETSGADPTSYSTIILELTRDQLMKLNDAQMTSTLKFVLVPYSVGAGIADDLLETMSEVEISTNPPGIEVTTTEVASMTVAEE